MNWLIPLSIALELSLRSPSVGDITDFLVAVEPEWSGTTVHVEYERENSARYLNYEICPTYEKERWKIEGSTYVSEARNINRQIFGVDRGFRLFRMGLAATTRRYDAPRTEGAVYVGLPLPGGRIRYLYGFGDTNILDVELELGVKDKYLKYMRLRPSIKGRFYREDDRLDWHVAFKFKYIFGELE